MPGFTIRGHGFGSQWPLVPSVRPQKNRLPSLVKRLCCEARFRAVSGVAFVNNLAGAFEVARQLLEGVSGALELVDLHRVRHPFQLVAAFLAPALEDSQ